MPDRTKPDALQLLRERMVIMGACLECRQATHTEHCWVAHMEAAIQQERSLLVQTAKALREAPCRSAIIDPRVAEELRAILARQVSTPLEQAILAQQEPPCKASDSVYDQRGLCSANPNHINCCRIRHPDVPALALPDEIRGDSPCQDCGGDNIKWFTLNVLWNEVNAKQELFGSEPMSIVCIVCWIKRAAAVGYTPSWLLVPGWPFTSPLGAVGEPLATPTCPNPDCVDGLVLDLTDIPNPCEHCIAAGSYRRPCPMCATPRTEDDGE